MIGPPIASQAWACVGGDVCISPTSPQLAVATMTAPGDHRMSPRIPAATADEQTLPEPSSAGDHSGRGIT